MTKRRLIVAGTLLAAALLWYYSAQLLTAYAAAFQIDNASKGADAIIVLGGNVETRPDHAAKLLREGYAKRLLLTSLRPMTTQHKTILRHETELAREIFATYGLESETIPSLKAGATSTFDEAYDLVAYMKTHPMRHIILVTDAFHTSRAHYAFRKIFALSGKEDVVIEMAATPNDIFDNHNWWRSERGLSAYILEPVKYLFYRFNRTNSTQFKED
jgi:uncharacterized SAM-binding protein YcdF (DUF218 family)